MESQQKQGDVSYNLCPAVSRKDLSSALLSKLGVSREAK